MYLAICFDTSMLIGMMVGLLVLGALGCAPLIYGVVALLKWAEARQKRLAAESPSLR